MKYPCLIMFACLSLAGCITVYGPGARGGGSSDHDAKQSDTASGSTKVVDTAKPIMIGNRKYAEVWEHVVKFYADQKLTVRVNDRETGLIAASSPNYPEATRFVDCSAMTQSSNVTHTLKVITRVDDMEHGVAVSVSVTGTASVVAGGSSKVARVDCHSNGAFEQALTAALRK